MGRVEQSDRIFRAEHVSKEFRLERKKKLSAVSDISFSINRGECVAIVGESGCGKSTLARMVSGILPVTEGRLEFMGRDVTHISYEEWRQLHRSMQIIFQDPMDAFSPRMKIGTFLCEPYVNFRVCRKKEARRRAAELLRKVELDETYLNQYPHQLSGGELQRVVIARSLALNPALLICDEITSALDVSIQAQIVTLLKQLQKTEQIALLFISHDLALVQNCSNRVIVMYQGRMVEELESQNMMNAKHEYTRKLLASVFSV